MQNTSAWPLRFTHRATVLGRGFVAVVELSGRLIARPESEGIWIDGVNPGALAFGVLTLAKAAPVLRDALQAVFLDIAEEAATADQFKTAVERFFNETDQATEAEWANAVADVRAGRVAGLPTDLPVEPADGEVRVQVLFKVIEDIRPGDNSERPSVLLAAA